MSTPCCCGGNNCASCPPGTGGVPDSFHLVLSGFPFFLSMFNGTWLCQKAGVSGGDVYWLVVDPPSGATVTLSCRDPNGLAGGALYVSAVTTNVSGGLVHLWNSRAPGTPEYTVACDPPDVRYPVGSFETSFFGVAQPLPTARGQIVA